MNRKQIQGVGRVGGFTIVALTMLAMFAGSADVSAAAEIKVSGEADACKGMFELIKEQVRDEIGASLLVKPTSSEQALLDLDKGDIDIATTDIPLETLISDLENKGYLILPESFQVQGIGTNTILVYLNKANRVTALSQGQLRDIFTGKVTNWKQVGGDNQKIVVVWGENSPDHNRLFSRYIIGSRPVTKEVVMASDQQDIIERVVRTPGAIGIASHVYKSGRTRNPKIPFVSAKVIAITKGAPAEDAQKLLEVVKSYDF